MCVSNREINILKSKETHMYYVPHAARFSTRDPSTRHFLPQFITVFRFPNILRKFTLCTAWVHHVISNDVDIKSVSQMDFACIFVLFLVFIVVDINIFVFNNFSAFYIDVKDTLCFHAVPLLECNYYNRGHLPSLLAA